MRESASKLLTELDSLRDAVIDIREKLSEYNAETIVRERLEEEGDKASGILWSAKRNQPTSTNPDILYKNMMSEWDKFLAVFRQRLIDANITPVMNRIGKMTYLLTDKRRRNPLPPETAELITALSSQYRRYTRLQGTKAQWLTPALHDEFVRLVETAISELDRPVGPFEPEPRSTHSGNATPRLIQ
jgi:hypothetical protein